MAFQGHGGLAPGAAIYQGCGVSPVRGGDRGTQRDLRCRRELKGSIVGGQFYPGVWGDTPFSPGGRPHPSTPSADALPSAGYGA